MKPHRHTTLGLLLAICLCLLTGCENTKCRTTGISNRNPLVIPAKKTKVKGDTKWKYASTKEEVLAILDGTWISAKIGGIWLKFVISQEHYTISMAHPSDGQWRECWNFGIFGDGSCEGTVTVHEGRFSNTGRSYVAVVIPGEFPAADEFGNSSPIPCSYKILFDGTGSVTLRVVSFLEDQLYAADVSKGNWNPWAR